MAWHELTTAEQLAAIKAASAARPQIVFKHSTRCGISSMALHRMQQGQDVFDGKAELYLLDLIRYRSLSNAIVDEYAVPHQSPQVLLIKDGECTLELSHMEITPHELLEAL